MSDGTSLADTRGENGIIACILVYLENSTDLRTANQTYILNNIVHSFFEIVGTMEFNASFNNVLGSSTRLTRTYTDIDRITWLSGIRTVAGIAVFVVDRHTKDIEPQVEVIHMNVSMNGDFLYRRAVAYFFKADIFREIPVIKRIRNKRISLKENLRNSRHILKSGHNRVLDRFEVLFITGNKADIAVFIIRLSLHRDYASRCMKAVSKVQKIHGYSFPERKIIG